MRGEKIITLDEPFQISEGGSFTEATTITLRAPGLGKRNVHFAMSSYVMEAIGNLQRNRPDLMRQSQETDSVLNVDDDEPAGMGHNGPPGEDDAKEAQAFWQMMQMGLGVEKFPAFADYVMRTLTGAPKFATVGENEVPLNDAAWESIDETNGMAAIEQICGTFVGFFMGAPKSPKTNGKGMPPSSSSRPKAASRSSTRAASRSPS